VLSGLRGWTLGWGVFRARLGCWVSRFVTLWAKVVYSGINVIKLFFSSSLTADQNKLDRLFLASFLQACLIFASKVWSLPIDWAL
jgi:hypothetical protein